MKTIRNVKTVIAIAALVGLAACASTPVTKVPVAVSGSKADGMIRMAYDEGAYENVTVDWASGEANALSRCQAWGYSRVESFAGGQNQCIENGRGILNGVPVGSCARRQYFKDYQCAD